MVSNTSSQPLVRSVCPAERYEPADDLCLVTSFFNPARFRSKRRNFLTFAEKIAASGLRLLAIECAFGDDEFELPASPDVLRVRARHVLWQKERLLNLLIARVPDRYTKIMWIDFDVVFEDAEWAAKTSRLLDTYALVQPFETAIFLPKDASSYEGEGRVIPGFAARYAADPTASRDSDFFTHGHVGHAWAARRDVLDRHGFYDACVAGGGDHVIAHAACGNWTTRCFDWSIGRDTAHFRHYMRWAEPFHDEVRGSVTYVPGPVLHIWHGRWRDRNYTDRHAALREYGFDPETDLRLGESGCWEWSSDKPGLHAWLEGYFARRHEDGVPEEAA